MTKPPAALPGDVPRGRRTASTNGSRTPSMNTFPGGGSGNIGTGALPPAKAPVKAANSAASGVDAPATPTPPITRAPLPAPAGRKIGTPPGSIGAWVAVEEVALAGDDSRPAAAAVERIAGEAVEDAEDGTPLGELACRRSSVALRLQPRLVFSMP